MGNSSEFWKGIVKGLALEEQRQWLARQLDGKGTVIGIVLWCLMVTSFVFLIALRVYVLTYPGMP